MIQALKIKELTGKHVLFIALTFFGVIFAMNFTMAYIAFDTFGGLDVKNSYHKGRLYNQVFDAAKVQEKQGWQMALHYEASGTDKLLVKVSSKDKVGTPLTGLDMRVKLKRPTNAHMDQKALLKADGIGTYSGLISVPSKGQWDLELYALQGKQERFKSVQRIVLK